MKKDGEYEATRFLRCISSGHLIERKTGLFVTLGFIVMLFQLIALPPVVMAQNAGNPPWPQFKGDAQHTGRSPYTIRCSSLLWTFEIEEDERMLSSSVTIGGDDTIYFVTYTWDGEIAVLTLYAVNPDGSLKWTSGIAEDGGVNIYASNPVPTIGPNGTIYVPTDTALVAINPNGDPVWVFEPRAYINCSPLVAPDGTIYIGAMNDTLYALNRDGSVRWEFEAPEQDPRPQPPIKGTPALGHDGTIYFSSADTLYALNSNGIERWTYTVREYAIDAFSILVGADGTVYFDSYGAAAPGLYALRADGRLKWTFPVPGAIFGVSIAPDETLYINSALDDTLRAVSPDGRELWRYQASIAAFPMTVDARGTVLFSSRSGDEPDDAIFGINSLGRRIWQYVVEDDYIDSTPVIARDGTIYITTAEGGLHAIGCIPPPPPPRIDWVDPPEFCYEGPWPIEGFVRTTVILHGDNFSMGDRVDFDRVRPLFGIGELREDYIDVHDTEFIDTETLEVELHIRNWYEPGRYEVSVNGNALVGDDYFELLFCGDHPANDRRYCAVNQLAGGGGGGEDIIYAFRDGFMAGSPEGKALIESYYRCGDELIGIFLKDPGLAKQTASYLVALAGELGMMMKYGNPSLSPLDTTNLEVVSNEIIVETLDLITEFKRYASPEFRKELLIVEQAFLENTASASSGKSSDKVEMEVIGGKDPGSGIYTKLK